MKTYKLIGGLFVTAAIVCTGSVFSGAHAKIKEEQKRLLDMKNSMSSVNFHKNLKNEDLKQISFGVNKACINAINYLEKQAQFEKMQIQTLDLLKNSKNESFKILKQTKLG